MGLFRPVAGQLAFLLYHSYLQQGLLRICLSENWTVQTIFSESLQQRTKQTPQLTYQTVRHNLYMKSVTS
jgi:hypothetical protein